MDVIREIVKIERQLALNEAAFKSGLATAGQYGRAKRELGGKLTYLRACSNIMRSEMMDGDHSYGVAESKERD